MIQSTIDVYEKIKEELRATPAKFHYLFNLRDVSKVIQGICMTKPISVQNIEALQKLWTNEVSRVFYDRLINDEDREWFVEFVLECLTRSFRSQLTRDDLFGERKVMWGDLLKLDSTQLYEEIKKPENLLKQLGVYLDDFNGSSSNRMNLVFFEDAVLHILRICRALRQPRGNLMCIGVGGSGKQSLLKLSSFMYGMAFKQIEIFKNYGENNFKDFLKERMFEAGINGERITFCLTDSQIIKETFLEFINNLLNTGEIPNLLLAEDKDKITNEVRPIVLAQKKLEDRPDNIYFTFVERVREFLHITLCMSPVGDDLRVRCRQFPSLVNCCTLDWFSRWPEEALLYVSSEFLKDLELPSQEVRSALSQMCMKIHTSVEEYSDRFFAELRRRVYTTPKSYLDLINLYLSQLAKKREELIANRNRLAGGLNKLTKTNTNIAELKIKLKEMQPELLQTKETLKVKKEKADIEKEKTDEQEAVVMQEKEVVEQIAAEAEAIKTEAETDLAIAQPELDKAVAAVQSLDKNAITELKSFASPHETVVQVMEAVLLVINKKPYTWDNAKKQMKDASEFLKKLQNHKIEETSEATFKKVREKYIKNPLFTEKEVSSKSLAAGNMCAWVVALCSYQIVYKKVMPKKIKLKEATEQKNAAESQLAAKMGQLAEVKSKVKKLEDECEALN